MPDAETLCEATQTAMAGSCEGTQAQPLGSIPTLLEGTHKILIVDDELWSALDMEWVVRQLGHDVVGPAATAEEAIELARSARPDLILMDIRLASNNDGIFAATEIRNQFDIASIFVSAHGDPVTRRRALTARPAGFIEKPFTPEALENAINAALRPDEADG